MYGFPSGVTAPEGAQKLVDVCKGTWAVIEDKESELLNAHNRAAESYTAAAVSATSRPPGSRRSQTGIACTNDMLTT